jgi:hypothetical protein
MSGSHVAAVVVMLIVCGCHREARLPETSSDAEPLRWLDHADVVADFTQRVEHHHDTRFVSLYALSTLSAYGLEDTPEVRQLIKQYGDRYIEGTTDIITSAEQQRLLHKARDYVKRYNVLLLHYLHDHPNT